MKKKIYAIALVCAILSSCNSNIENVLEGGWSIDTIYYRNYDVRACLLINIIEFKGHHECDLPITEYRCGKMMATFNKESKWEVHRTDSVPLLLKIDSKNNLFSGNHRIVFKKDEQNKLLKMEISSDSLYIICRKGFYDYNRNISTINDLVEMSKPMK